MARTALRENANLKPVRRNPAGFSVGIVSFVYPGSADIFGFRTDQITHILRAGNQERCPTYVFRPDEIDLTTRRVNNAYFMNPEGQIERVHDIALPPAIIMKRKSPENQEGQADTFTERLAEKTTLLNPPGWGKLARDKDWTGRAMQENQVPTPAHDVYKDAKQVALWVEQHGKVFLKPQMGTWGKGHIVVGMRRDGKYFLHYREQQGKGKKIRVQVGGKGLQGSILKAFERIGSQDAPYLIQEAIDSATHTTERQPFQDAAQVARLALNGPVTLHDPSRPNIRPLEVERAKDGRYVIRYTTPIIGGIRLRRKVVTPPKNLNRILLQAIQKSGHAGKSLQVTGQNKEGAVFTLRAITARNRMGEHQIAGIAVLRGQPGEEVANYETETIHQLNEMLEETFGRKKAPHVEQRVRQIAIRAVKAIDRKLVGMGKTPLGHTCVELIVDRAGRPHVLEFNSMPMTNNLSAEEKRTFGRLQLESVHYLHQRQGS